MDLTEQTEFLSAWTAHTLGKHTKDSPCPPHDWRARPRQQVFCRKCRLVAERSDIYPDA